MERRNGWINVGELQGAVHFRIVKYERIKFLVIALKDSIEIYAWAPKPYHKFMAFKSFGELQHRWITRFCWANLLMGLSQLTREILFGNVKSYSISFAQPCICMGTKRVTKRQLHC